MTDPSISLTRLLDALRLGDIAAQGEVLQHCRPWLHLLARLEIDGRFRGKFDASDIVQQTLLGACRDLPKFRGGDGGRVAGLVAADPGPRAGT